MEQPDKIEFTGDELLWLRGQQAEEFLRFIDGDGKYYREVLENIRLRLCAQILGLQPDERERFSVLKAQLEGHDMILKVIETDVEIGKMAKQRIDGEIPANREGIDLL